LLFLLARCRQRRVGVLRDNSTDISVAEAKTREKGVDCSYLSQTKLSSQSYLTHLSASSNRI
jgi:hypothetical protein